MVVEQTKDVIERRAELRGHNATLWPILSILTIRQNVDFGNRQSFTCQPDDVMIQLQGLGISRSVQLA